MGGGGGEISHEAPEICSGLGFGVLAGLGFPGYAWGTFDKGKPLATVQWFAEDLHPRGGGGVEK